MIVRILEAWDRAIREGGQPHGLRQWVRLFFGKPPVPGRPEVANE
jgi:hypothetical protein